jgi:hypothetical protein
MINSYRDIDNMMKDLAGPTSKFYMDWMKGKKRREDYIEKFIEVFRRNGAKTPSKTPKKSTKSKLKRIKK